MPVSGGFLLLVSAELRAVWIEISPTRVFVSQKKQNVLYVEKNIEKLCNIHNTQHKFEKVENQTFIHIKCKCILPNSPKSQ